MDEESSFLPHYEKLYDIVHTIGNQNYALFDFIISRGLIEDWNEYYRQRKEQKQWITDQAKAKKVRKHRQKGV